MQDQVKMKKVNVTQISPEEGERLHVISTERQATQEILNDAIVKCRQLVAQSARQSNEWWKEMSAKYGFDVESNLGFDAVNNTIYRIEPDVDEATMLANSDPDSIQ